MTFGRTMKIESIADLQDLESALIMAIHTTEVMIEDKDSFNAIERATMQTQINRWSGLLGRIQEYGK